MYTFHLGKDQVSFTTVLNRALQDECAHVTLFRDFHTRVLSLNFSILFIHERALIKNVTYQEEDEYDHSVYKTTELEDSVPAIYDMTRSKFDRDIHLGYDKYDSGLSANLAQIIMDMFS
jgi:hypothetical protein